MALYSGYIRLQNGTDELFWNEIDNQGVVEDVDQFLGWDDWTVFQQIFFVNPPSIPVFPTNREKRTNYFISDRVRVFRSDRIRVFTA